MGLRYAVEEGYQAVTSSEEVLKVSPAITAQTRVIAALRSLNKRNINRDKALDLIDGALLAINGVEEPSKNTFFPLIDAVLTNFLEGRRSITQAERELREKAESEDKKWLLVTRA
jgi:hypothetical protein